MTLAVTVLILLLGVSAASRCGYRPLAPRIVSGVNASPHSWPWQAELLRTRQDGGLRHSCGGTLVHPKYVVTAAHCIFGNSLNELVIRLGNHRLNVTEPSEQDFRPKRIVKHPHYSNAHVDSDVAVIELDRPAFLTDRVNIACLPQQGQDVQLNATCYVSGWGNLYGGGPTPNILQEAYLPLVSNSVCARGNNDLHSINVTENMLCAGFGGNSSVSGCHGDSGGPFVCRNNIDGRWVLQGAVSWGSSTCSAGKTYSVFARISRLRNFIDSVISNKTFPRPTKTPCATQKPWTTRRPWTSRPTTRPQLQNGTCNFDSRSCGFVQSQRDQFDFTLNTGSTPSQDTGPSADHTSNHGQYIYAEASSPRRPGDEAIMTKRVYIRNPACFSFYYHMHGADMGWLKVYVNDRLAWQLHGNQGNQWIKATIPVIQNIGFIKFEVKAIIGNSYTSDIALDDFGYQEHYYIYSDVCDLTPSCARPGSQPTKPFVTLPPLTTAPPLPPYNGSCGSPSIPPSRVIGGVDARPGSWPWQVGLRAYNQFFCGGSLIHPRWVVTAAHCIIAGATYEVTLGDFNRTIDEGYEQRINSLKTIVHPNWNSSTIDADIALIYLSRPAFLNDRVKTVCLPRQNEYLAPGTSCYITGWGKVRHPGGAHDTLQQAELPVVNQTRCQEKLNAGLLGQYNMTVTRNMVCGGVENSIKSGCHGDSGGPFVCQARSGRWVLQGAVSWGSGRCNTDDTFTVFARVARFRSWIDWKIRSV